MQSRSACPTCGFKPKDSAVCKTFRVTPRLTDIALADPEVEIDANGVAPRLVSVWDVAASDSDDSKAANGGLSSQGPKRQSARTAKEPIKATDIDTKPTLRQLKIARTKMLKVLLPAHQEDWAVPILHAFPSFRKLALASRADITKILKGKKRRPISRELANRIYHVFH